MNDPLPLLTSAAFQSDSYESHSSAPGSLSPPACMQSHQQPVLIPSIPSKKSKAGRKFATDEAPNKRVAQNRASQRSYQERKAAHLRDLEARVAFCKLNHGSLVGYDEALAGSTACNTEAIIAAVNVAPVATNTVTSPTNMATSAAVTEELVALRRRVSELEAENARLVLVKHESLSQSLGFSAELALTNLLMSSSPPASTPPQMASLNGSGSPFLLDPLLSSNNFSSPLVPTGTPFLFDTTVLAGSQNSSSGMNSPTVLSDANTLRESPMSIFSSAFYNPFSTANNNQVPWQMQPKQEPIDLLQQNNVRQDQVAKARPSKDGKWDLSKLDRCQDCHERISTSREMLKSIKSVNVKKEGAVLVDELCDLMENFCIKCRECEEAEVIGKPQALPQVNAAGVPADDFSISLLRVMQTRFKLLEACDSEEDREKIIDLMRYSRKKNTLVCKNFGRMMTIMRQALTSIVDPLISSSNGSGSVESDATFDFSSSGVDTSLGTSMFYRTTNRKSWESGAVVFDLTKLDDKPILEQTQMVKTMLKSLKSFRSSKDALIVDHFVDFSKAFFEIFESEGNLMGLSADQFEIFHREQVYKLYRAKFELLEACQGHHDRERVLELISYIRMRSQYFQKHSDLYFASLKESLRI